VADRLADMHFCVSQIALQHLAAEGISASVYWVGDVMLDAMLQNRRIAQQKSDMLARLNLKPGGYTLATIHRAANTDDAERLKQIVHIFNSVQETIVFPVHPRTRKALSQLEARFKAHVK
jgi:UDP-N-acetylglucosamine 2-epimerase